MHMLETLAKNTRAAIADGTYDISYDLPRSGADLPGIIRESAHPPIIAEIKFSSPSLGSIRAASDPAPIAQSMAGAGAVAISVLTQPYLFGGSPDILAAVRRAVNVPIIMKDIILDEVQIDAAGRTGADYILLIRAIFERGLACDMDRFIAHAHEMGIGVLVEAHTAGEFERSLDTDADLVGINNRNLDTMEIDLGTTGRILDGYTGQRTIVSESGIETARHIADLRRAGAGAFLVGSGIMKASDIGARVRELAGAY